MMASTGGEELCQRLQTLQLQLKVVLERNKEVLSHLEQVEASILTDSSSNIDHNVLTESLKVCQYSSKQVQEIAEKQCGGLEEQIRELARQSDDDQFGGLNRVPDTSASPVRQQLISQLDFNVALQKEKVELETRLIEELDLRVQSNKANQGLQADVAESQEKMRSVLNRLDKTAKDAEDRLMSLGKETEKAQKSSEEYKKLYEEEKKKIENYDRVNEKNSQQKRQSGNTSHRDLTPMARKTRTSPTQPYLFQAPMMRAKSAGPATCRPQDMDTKYLCLVDENKDLHSEMRRLRDENTYLMRCSKDSKRDAATTQSYIATSQTQRSELQIRLRREQEEHRRLVTSMNKQAASWVSEKKMIRGMENNSRTAKLQSEPVFGAQRRLKSHPIKLNENKPRDIPVQLW